jgi:small neutral amino acid transporter SnatA (MarC family)
MNPHLKTFLRHVLRGFVLFTTFNLFGVFVYKTLRLNNESIWVAGLIFLISMLIFYLYSRFIDPYIQYEK